MPEIYLLTLALTLAGLLGLLGKRLKQPLIVAYLLAGAVLSGVGLVTAESFRFLRFLPEIGLAFLLFLVGMELDFAYFRSLGRNVVIVAGTQIAIGTLVLGWIMTSLGGAEHFWLGGALAFSSTILVVKLLLDKKELASLHGRLAVGVLLIEDLLAVVVLMFLTTATKAEFPGPLSLFLVLGKGIFLGWLLLWIGKKILPRLTAFVADSAELLFLVAICWCLVSVALSALLGFSLGIGAFLAGVSLAQSTYRVAISAKIKPLRDFFILLFFVDLGTNFSLQAAFSSPWLVAGVLGYTVVIKPIIFFSTLVFLKFRAKTAFQTAILLSSVSELSLIITFLAQENGFISPALTSAVIFAVVLSFVFSSLLSGHSRVIYRRIGAVIKKAEREKIIHLDSLPVDPVDFSRHAVLAGCHRSGEIVVRHLKKIYQENFVVVDFNPEVVEKLRLEMTPCLYGDVADPEIQEKLNLKTAALVVSTVRDLESNLAILDGVGRSRSPAVVVMTAADAKEAMILYERGAHHVTIPVTLEGYALSRLIVDYQNDLAELAKMRERKLGELKRSNHGL